MVKRSSILKLAALTAALCLSAGCAVTGPAQQPAAGTGAMLLSGPYAIHPAIDGATVCWQTVQPSAGAVRYRAADAAGSLWTEVASPVAGAFHSVRLAGLDPGTMYHAETLAGGEKVGALAFRTVPKEAESFTFFVYGDTRSNPREHSMVADALLAEAERLGQRTFVLHTGDLADTDADEEVMSVQFFRPAAGLLARLPIAAVRGNHENGRPELLSRYFPAPPDPGTAGLGETSCLDYGSVRLIVLDKYLSPELLQVQKRWLADRLAEAKDRWRLLAIHEPIYTSGLHGPAMTTRGRIEGVVVEGKTHVFFGGHDHNYERTKPIHGVTYIITGGGGAELRGRTGVVQRHAWTARFESTLHFLAVDVRPEKLTIRALRPAARGGAFEVFDTVDIPRDCGWPASLPVPALPAATAPAVPVAP